MGSVQKVSNYRETSPSLLERARAVETALENLMSAIDEGRQRLERDLRSIRLVSREQAAELLSLSPSQIDRLTKAGRMPVVYLDRRPRYPLEKLCEFIEARTTLPRSQAEGSNSQNRKCMKPSCIESPEEGLDL